MGIGPLELLDDTFQCHLAVGIKHSEGMMRESGAREDGDSDAREAERFECHGRLQQLLILWPIPLQSRLKSIFS
jgi:hypothetical protein